MSFTPSTNMDPLTPLAFLNHSAWVYPEKTAVVHGHRRINYRELHQRSHRLGQGLRSIGVEPGDRVAILCWNIPPMLEAHYGVPFLQAMLVAINTRLSAEEILYILEHSGSKVLIVDTELAQILAPIEGRLPKDLKIVTIVDDQLESPPASPFKQETLDYEELLAAASEEPVPIKIEDETLPLSINYTSGTTGRPKGVMYTHRGAALNAFGTPIYCGINRYSIYLWTLPMFHCNGWLFPYSVTLVSATHICLRKFVPEKVFDLVGQEGVTHFCGAPTVLLGVTQYSEQTGRRFPHPVHANVAGAPPSPTLLAACDKIGISVAHLYGLTETYGPHTYCAMEPEWLDHPEEERAILLARQGVPTTNALHIRVVDEQMNDVEKNGEQMGEVCMRGNNVMAGYYNDPEATAHAFRGGWFHSGDLAVWHPDNYIEVRDRGKDIIISGGENISSIEVEKTLVKHPGILEAAVIAIPDDKWGEVPKAFVSLKPDANLTESEVIQFCRDNLAHFKCPKQIEFCELPKTSTSKIQKFVLRDQIKSTDAIK
ncbi:MAG: long-chain-fatty-acid--CoA ligase [Candidatus Omnitrophica bacterium]|nr:long-chain-fatty-acid--CoA ligase [Candidatus Omnitrophota bacterium]